MSACCPLSGSGAVLLTGQLFLRTAMLEIGVGVDLIDGLLSGVHALPTSYVWREFPVRVGLSSNLKPWPWLLTTPYSDVRLVHLQQVAEVKPLEVSKNVFRLFFQNKS